MMDLTLLTLCLIFLRIHGFTEANSANSPRMTFTAEEAAVRRFPSPGHHAFVRILPDTQPDSVTAVGKTDLYSYNFKSSQTPSGRKVMWKECMDQHPEVDCSYNITVVHKREEGNQAFVCGSSKKETLCCEMNLSMTQPTCDPSGNTEKITESIRQFITKENEASALAESAGSAELYIARSQGSQHAAGIHKFGADRVRPVHHDKEQHYVGLMLSRGRQDPVQDRVYAFYKEKNKDTSFDSSNWLPFVTQVCMADKGGPKTNLQFSWTSQMSARLFCGDPHNGQFFSELVDVSIIHAVRWQDTRVYALFRNEWGMSAVCVYTVHDIDHIFMTSPFKDNKLRPRECVADSKSIPLDTLRLIEKTSEMKDWVQPVNTTVPLLFNHHKYNHIYVHSSEHERNNHMVLFLSLNNGGIHKVIETKIHTFIIAEYQPLTPHDHILSIILHPASRKLYVNAQSELVQLDVANCAKYGDKCQDCVLARDPYCGWNGAHCTTETQGTVQDVDTGNHRICQKEPQKDKLEKVFRSPAKPAENLITLTPESKHFLQCPMSSYLAQYTWRHGETSTPCMSVNHQCLLLINDMAPEKEGTYECVSVEQGYTKVLAQYQLQVENGATGRLASPLVWVCLTAALSKSLSLWS